MTGAVIALHAWLLRPFMLVSFDQETALAHGVRVRAVDAVLFLSLGLTIAVATRTIGAMPVFAFCLLPAAAALRTFEDLRAVLASAALVGSASAFLGYWASFAWELPTGACTVVVATLFLLPASIIGRFRGKE
jgi:ABC-type Mn2+/Zn2+ transport system permease subunit